MATITQTATMPTGDVRTDLNYYLELADGGVSLVRGGTAESVLRKFNPKPVTIHDLRKSNGNFGLDTSGFQLVHAPTKFNLPDVVDNQEAFDEFAKVETMKYLKAATGCTRCQVFSSTFRRFRNSDALSAARKADSKESLVPIVTPLQYIHVDQSYDGAITALRGALEPAEFDLLTKSRWAIVNVWRPLHPVKRDPLGVCDARTVDDADLRAVKLEGPKGGLTSLVPGFKQHSASATAENWNVAYNPKHVWYYASNMGTDEVLMIKNYDSRTDGTARRTPHTAFQFPEQDDTMPPRESCEIRCLVFWENEKQE